VLTVVKIFIAVTNGKTEKLCETCAAQIFNLPAFNYLYLPAFGSGLELPMSTTTFHWPSFCFLQIEVYLP
jgi:hypothetical protein